jgi:protein SCO1/2
MRNTILASLVLVLMAACTPAAPAAPAAGGETPRAGVVSSGMPTPKASCNNRSSDAIGGPFHLTSHTGSPTTEDNFKGHKTLVFFGYTYCPDICPITLFNLGKAISLLPPGKTAPKTVFISVDPARDTPEAIAQYIQSNGFPKDIVGLTGTLDELRQVNDAFATTFSRDEDADTSAGYLVSHSSILYLMDENWKLRTYFTQDESPETIAACLADLG